MTDNQKDDQYYTNPDSGAVEKTVTIKPGSGRAVGLGVFKATSGGPEVQVTYKPDLREDIGISHERLEIPGQSKYILLYQFQNFSQKSCRITMHLSGAVSSRA